MEEVERLKERVEKLEETIKFHEQLFVKTAKALKTLDGAINPLCREYLKKVEMENLEKDSHLYG